MIESGLIINVLIVKLLVRLAIIYYDVRLMTLKEPYLSSTHNSSWNTNWINGY